MKYFARIFNKQLCNYFTLDSNGSKEAHSESICRQSETKRSRNNVVCVLIFSPIMSEWRSLAHESPRNLLRKKTRRPKLVFKWNQQLQSSVLPFRFPIPRHLLKNGTFPKFSMSFNSFLNSHTLPGLLGLYKPCRVSQFVMFVSLCYTN